MQYSCYVQLEAYKTTVAVKRLNPSYVLNSTMGYISNVSVNCSAVTGLLDVGPALLSLCVNVVLSMLVCIYVGMHVFVRTV